jgi:hypothetical protein
MSDDDIKDWKETILRRVRNLARVVGQPLLKGKTPAWMKKLTFFKKIQEEDDDVLEEQDPDHEDDEEEQEDDEEEEEQAAKKKPAARPWKKLEVKEAYVVKFCKENMIAVRSPIGKPEEQILSFGITDDAEKLGSDIVMATFKDGTSDGVPGLTYEALRSITRKPAATLATGMLWSEEHATTHHLVHISQRVDRCLLLSVYEQSLQRMQIRMDKFGPVEDQAKQLPADSDVLQRALAFVKPIAEKFARGEIEAKEMTVLRNAGLNNMAARPAAQVNGKPARVSVKEKKEASAATNEGWAANEGSAAPKLKRTKTQNLPEYEPMEDIPMPTSSAFERLDRFLQ